MPKYDDNWALGLLYEKLEAGVRYTVERSASLSLDDEQDRESLIEVMVPILVSFILTDEPGNEP